MKTKNVDAHYVAKNGKHYQVAKASSGKYYGSELRKGNNGQPVNTGRGVFFSSQRHAVHACEAHSTQSEAVFTYEHQTHYRTVGRRQDMQKQGVQP